MVGACIGLDVQVGIWIGETAVAVASNAVATKIAVGELTACELQLTKTSTRIEFTTKCFSQQFVIL
jgi:hypothetical protein